MDIKNVITGNGKTAYDALSEVVAICGIESVLSALSEIAAEQGEKIETEENLSPWEADKGTEYLSSNTITKIYPE